HASDPDDQLKDGMDGDRACSPCHDDVRGAGNAHTHHAADSAGSRCQNCHMPYTTFGLLKAIRSHRIDSPSVHANRSTGRPHACHLCHLDRSLRWTAAQLTAWYGAPVVELPDDDEQIAASLRWLLQGDAAQRALAAWAMGWEPARVASGREWLPP